MKGFSKRLSMRSKILWSTFTMILILTAISAIEMRLAATAFKNKVLKEFEGHATKIGDAVAAQFFERYGDVQAFAINPVFAQPDKEAMADALDHYATLYSIYDVIVVVDAEGRFVASNRKAPGGQALELDALKPMDFSKTPWFRAVVNGQFTEDKSRGYAGTYFEDAHIDPITTAALGSPQYVTSFSAPVKDKDGRLLAVISNRANFIWVENEFIAFSKLMQQLGLKQTEFSIVSHQGELLLNYDPFTQDDDKVIRDFDVLLKPALGHNLSLPIKELMQGHSGHGFVYNPNKKTEQAVGYYVLSSSKWIPSIGWGVMVKDVPAELLADVIAMQRDFYIGSSICMIFFMVLSWLATSHMTQRFIAVSDKLREAAEMTTRTADRLTASSQTVAAASTEQSAAVQETVASMSEISSMIAQTNQNTKDCTSIATRVSSKTEQGNQVMRRLATSMDAVHHANSQLQNMAHIINEVSAKTMVINDIVFKTQLLSINASIEAARAGEHGKGFSVVAEEVGNLAQMSGNAAKEIQNLLTDSQKQVAHIIEITQSRTQESRSVSEEALSAFTEIAGGIQAINERLQGVAQATREQELGIQQINIAMRHMDETTQRNSIVANEANALAQELGKQSERTYRVMRAFRTLVLGVESEKPAPAPKDIIATILDDKELEFESGPRLPKAQGDSRTEPGSERLQEASQKILQKLGGDSPDFSTANSDKDSRAPLVDADDPSFRRAG